MGQIKIVWNLGSLHWGLDFVYPYYYATGCSTCLW